MSFPVFPPLGILPQSTIVPKDDNLFIPYFTRTYEAISQAVNAKDSSFFPISITSTATNIPGVPSFGAFVVAVSGVSSTLPTATWCLCKADATSSGASGIAVLAFQAGTSTWSGKVLTITSTATNFQIAHNNTGVTGSFNIRIMGTQS